VRTTKPLRPAMRGLTIILIGSALGSAAACTETPRNQAKKEAKNRVGTRLADTPLKRAATETLDPTSMARDRTALQRVLSMTWQEVAMRLNRSLSWQGKGFVRYRADGGRELALDEEATLRFAPKPEALDLLVTNDSGFHQHLIFSNGVLYQKYNNGTFQARKDLENIRHQRGDEAFGLVSAPLALLARRLEAATAPAATIAGRQAVCYKLRLGADISVAPTSSVGSPKSALGDLHAWRQSLVVTELTGRLCVDQARVVPLLIEVEASGRRERPDAGKGNHGMLTLKLKGELLSAGKAPAISAPTEYLKALKRKRRKRPPLDPLRRGGLPLPKPEGPDAG
jgi:hypothetical protein